MAEASSRCFPNPWLKDQDCKPAAKKRRDPQEVLSEMRPRLLLGLEQDLGKVDDFYLKETKDQSVYTGSAGAALLHLHLATTLYSSDAHQKNKHLLKSLSLIASSLTNLDTRRHTFLCGAPGTLAIATVVYLRLDRKSEGLKCLEKLKTLYRAEKEQFKSIPCELLYGCAGYLFALLFVRTHVRDSIEQDLIDEVCGLLISRGQEGYERSIASPMMYTWHGKHYLGAAHGLAGIMAILLQASAHSDVVSGSIDAIQQTTDYLLSLQLPSKNFPSSLESSGKDRLVQWCHGAPGFVHLWSTAYRVLNKPEYLKAARDCGDMVWEKGLLRKGYGMCHGVGGNGYTFLQLYRLTGEAPYLHRAIKFAEWCLTSNDRDSPLSDRPFSLFEGLSGKLYFLLDMCINPQDTRFPGLELPYVQSELEL